MESHPSSNITAVATVTSIEQDDASNNNATTTTTTSIIPQSPTREAESVIQVSTPTAAEAPASPSNAATAASVITATTPQATSISMPPNEELLLRDWAPDHHHHPHDEDILMPPVAPAVVLNETSEGSATSSTTPRVYSYPVATFVSNFVRHSVNELRDHIMMANPIYAVTAVPEEGETTTRTVNEHAISIRSSPGNLMPTTTTTTSASTLSSAAAAPPRDVHHHRFMDESDDDGTAEYVLIDGDLVAIPALHEQYMDDYDYSVGRGSRRQRSRAASRQGSRLSSRGSSQYQQEQDDEEKDDNDSHATDSRPSQTQQSQNQQQQQQQKYQQQQRYVEEEEEDDDGSGDYLHRNSNRANTSPSVACRPNHSRMHRGMRKVKKWIKRKNLLPRRGTWHKSSTPPSSIRTLESQGVESILTANSSSQVESEVLEDLSVAAAGAAAGAEETESISTEDPHSPSTKTKRKKKRWMRDLETQNEQGGGSGSINRSLLVSSAESSVASMVTPTTPPTAATARGPTVASLPPRMDVLSLDHQHHSLDYNAGATPPLVPSAPMMEDGLQRRNSTSMAAFSTDIGLGGGARRTPTHSRHNSHSGVAAYLEASPLDAHPHDTPSLNRQASIAAEYVGYVGSEDQWTLGAENVLAAEAYIEDRLDDYDKYDKKDDSYFPRSLVPRDADFKVDKQDAPCVDMMLRRAGEDAQELTQEDDIGYAPLLAPAPFALSEPKGKSDGESVPLSMASAKDTLVHNDILKLVMVGDARVDKTALARSLRQSSKKARKKRTTLGVDVHTWTPPNDDHVKFTIWDVQGASVDASPYDANFGAHPGTQSLFFSDRSLYLLVWDLAAWNPKTYRRAPSGDDDSDEDFDDEEDENEYLREEANRQADRALQSDIEDRVLSWVDCIARRGSHSAILPVAMVSGDMSPEEAKRRCDTMQMLMMRHTERMENAPKVLSGAETVLCVSLGTNMGMDLLQETILAIATDASHSVFDHVGTPVPPGTTMVLETCRRLKTDHKLVLVDHLLAELMPLKGETGMLLSVEEVMEALHFLSAIGEVLYFGGVDDVLSHYVILSRKWLVSALSCILRNDLKRELQETRRFMNMQCLYSDQQFPENHVTQTFSNSTSNCPLLSSSDTQMLWQSMSFMREAADMTSQLQENTTTNSTMFGFLEHLLVHTGVFLPLDIDRFASPDMVYFVPSLLAQADTREVVWTYKSSESWMTTLAHSWLFRDGAPSGLMEHVTVALLRDLYEFSHVVASKPHSPPPRAQTFPFAQNSLTDFIDNHDGEAIGRIKIHQIMCWRNSLTVKIGCVFPEGNELRESFAEIFVTITDPSSPYCVASDAMRSNMHRLIISGKGPLGHHGRKLWRGGYNVVLDSIKASVADCTNVDLQVVCPECLAHAHPSSSSTWSWDSVRAAAETGSAVVRCMRGHRVDSNLICGTVKAAGPKPDGLHIVAEAPKKPVKDLLPSVVLVGLWDPKANSVLNVGSGFIVDKKQGLIVTAGHILFDMEEGRTFGTPYFGIKNAKVVIGLIPEGARNNDTARFRYFAEIMADDIHSMDACVLKITTRLENDVDDESLVGQQSERVVDVQEEQLPALKMTRRFELEETVRILGFNQAGEGWLEQGKHVNRSADFAKGYICKQFKLAEDHSDSESDDSSSSGGCFSPREELVIMCPTIPGHSGGPCVNEEGKVVGILSRADPVDRQRCYLVPASELKTLVSKARGWKSSSRVAALKQSY